MVGVGDRIPHRLDAVSVRVMVVVGEGEQQEVVGVVLDQLPPDAPGIGVASPGARQRRLAGNPAARIQLAVEELVRAPHRMAEVRGDGHPPHQAL